MKKASGNLLLLFVVGLLGISAATAEDKPAIPISPSMEYLHYRLSQCIGTSPLGESEAEYYYRIKIEAARLGIGPDEMKERIAAFEQSDPLLLLRCWNFVSKEVYGGSEGKQ